MLLSFYNGDDVKISESNGETTRNLARERESVGETGTRLVNRLKIMRLKFMGG